MADYLIQESTLDSIARAINNKAGTQVAMTPAQMVTAIENISGGGGITGWGYQKFTFTPTEEVGRYGSGGYPATEQYITNLLPEGWTFAKIIKQSGQVQPYGFVELHLGSWNNVIKYIRYNANGDPESRTDADTTASYSIILSPNCVYQVEVFKVV